MGTIIRTMGGDPDRSPNRLLVITLPVILGALVVLTLMLIILRITKRRRKTKRHFNQAQLRDPSLTWEEFERRGNLTRSRLIFEEELLRNAIIRKTQQNRESGSKEAVAEEEAARPTRTRSKTWHGRTRSLDVDIEDGRQLLQDTVMDWGSAQANVERTWQLLHGKKYPPLEGNRLLWDEDDEGTQRPPTVRLKTPPLLSHPVFQGSPGQLPPKHLSLPTELIRVKTEPDIVGSSTKMQQSGE